MKTKFFIFLVLFVCISLLTGCFAISELAGSSAMSKEGISKEWQLVLADDFLDLNNWKVDLDTSVGQGCAAPSESSIALEVASSMRGKSYLKLVSNATELPGAFINAIAHTEFSIPENFKGYLKTSASAFFPKEYPGHFADLAFNVVFDGTGHSAEIFIGLDPNMPEYYGWVNVRTFDLMHVNVLDLKAAPDWQEKWHAFELIVFVDVENDIYRIESVKIDDSFFNLNNYSKYNWVMPKFEKSGWPNIVQVYFEQHNLYNNCSADQFSTGVSYWSSFRLYQKLVDDE